MKTLISFASALALIAILPGCGGSDEPADEASAESGMDAEMADPNNPFAASEMKMSEAMAAEVGINAADSWVRKMIEHHQGAVDMSRILLDQGITGHVADMARQTIDMQGKEIEALRKLVATGDPDPASAQLYAAVESQMHDAMMAAKGSDVSDTFIRKMLEHHKGAIALSDIALANGAAGAVRTQIVKTKAAQQKEIDHIEGMLSGSAEAPAEQDAPAAKSPPVAAKTAASPKAAPAKPAPAPTKATATPAETKAATPTCSPEHRAAGHC